LKIRITEKNGIYFTENELDFVENIRTMNHKIDGIFGHAMLKNLSDLKEDMANLALSINCNLIHSFKYAQTSKGGGWRGGISLRAVFGADDVYWEGAGICARISPEKLEEIIEQQKELE
jgi:hypothetical protein